MGATDCGAMATLSDDQLTEDQVSFHSDVKALLQAA